MKIIQFFTVIALCAIPLMGLEADINDIKAVIPDTVTMREIDAGHAVLLDANGAECGSAWEIADVRRRPKGFRGRINVTLIIGSDGKVAGVLPCANDETPRFFQRVLNSGLFQRWNGMNKAEAATAPIDAVTHATISSSAVITAVRDLAARADGGENESSEPEVDVEALTQEQSALRNQLSKDNYVLACNTVMLHQYQTKRTEEMEFRLLMATQGAEKALEYARQQDLMVSRQYLNNVAESKLGDLGRQYMANASDDLLAQIKTECAKELDAIVASQTADNAARAQAILTAMERVRQINIILANVMQ